MVEAAGRGVATVLKALPAGVSHTAAQAGVLSAAMLAPVVLTVLEAAAAQATLAATALRAAAASSGDRLCLVAVAVLLAMAQEGDAKGQAAGTAPAAPVQVARASAAMLLEGAMIDSISTSLTMTAMITVSVMMTMTRTMGATRARRAGSMGIEAMTMRMMAVIAEW